MVADLDLRFQNAIADDLPSFLVNPSAGLEESSAVSDDLAAVRGAGTRPRRAAAEEAEAGVDAAGLRRRARLRRHRSSGSTRRAASRCRSRS